MRGSLVKGENHESDSNLWRFLSRTAVARKLAWFVSSKSFVPPFLTSMTLCPVLFGGYWYSSPYMEHMILAVETIALFTRCRLTTVSLHFLSECSAWHVLLHGNIIVVATSLPAALKQHNSDQLSANCGQVLAHNFFFFLAIVLGNLLGAVVMPLLSTLKILFCAEKFLIFSNTALKLSKYLVTWTLLKPVFLPKLHFSEQSEIFCLLQTWPLSPFQQSYFLS